MYRRDFRALMDARRRLGSREPPRSQARVWTDEEDELIMSPDKPTNTVLAGRLNCCTKTIEQRRKKIRERQEEERKIQFQRVKFRLLRRGMKPSQEPD